MNSVTLVLVWCALQVTLVALATAAMYLTVGRRSPAVGSAILVAGSIGVLLTTALAASPWPRWYTVAWKEAPAEQPAPVQPAVIEPVAAEQPAAKALPAASPRPTFTPADASFATALVETLRTGFTVPAADAPRTTPWGALLIAAGVAMCVGRLTLGLAVVRNYRRRSAPVVDEALCRELAQLQAEMNCSRPVELRESESLSSPAVVGWWRPLLLLPLDWRTWSEGERRAVLAHELAHVCRGDYPAWLLSQLGLALHFYHPLVHWLVRRLRLEQELAADEWGAQLVGSRTAYLRALAQLALRRDARPVVWAAQPFFPRRDTFLRRIEMLRHQQHLPWQPTSRLTRAAAVSAVLAAALLAVGLRGPETALAQLGARPADAPQPTGSEKFSLKFVPAEAVYVAVVRPADLLATPGMADTWKRFPKLEALVTDAGIDAASLAEVTLIGLAGAPAAAPIRQIVVLRSKQPADWKQLAEKYAPGARVATAGGRTFYSTRIGHREPAFYEPDRQTLVLGTELQIRELIERSTSDAAGPAWAETWKSQQKGPLRFALNVQAFKTALGINVEKLAAAETSQGPIAPVMAMLGPVAKEVSAIVGSAQLGEETALSASLLTSSGEAAASVAETSLALKTLLKNLAAGHASPPPPAERFLSLMTELLAKTEIKVDGSAVRMSARSGVSGAAATDALLTVLTEARSTSERVQSANNCRQLALAMHNYADQHGAFPPAVLYGPDGKTPYSWRVALLPYLEQEALYKQYRRDEPWDSAANLKVLEQMPDTYRVTGVSRADKNADYFVFTGPETLFSGKQGRRLGEVTDGLSNTLLLVEAQRDIPWTKPEDLPYASDQPLPALGGLLPRGFNLALADGSVRFFSQEFDEKTLRALITARGDEHLLDPNGGPLSIE